MLGAERELVLASGMISVILVITLGNLVLAALGVTFWIVSLFVFQRMAKADPQLLRVYVRHVNKKIFYPAQPHFCALEPEPKKHQ